MAVKGKQIAEKAPPSKRKRIDEDKSGKAKRKNPGVLQFFDVAADVVDETDEESSDDDFDDDLMDEVNAEQKEKSEFGKTHNLPFLPKEEELSDGELEILLEERYKPGSKYVVYADDKNKAKGSGENDSLVLSMDDQIIWRVKCTVGRERRAAFCLIQKFVDLQSLGNKLKIASAFAPDHIKGYIYIEAEREFDVLEACKGLSNVYSSRVSRVPKNEVVHLFSVRDTSLEVPPGTWVRVKLGNYRGDLAQVVAFDDDKKSATVKIIPRIDLQALAKKLAGGSTVKQTTIPAARVISSRDLEEFRPHIQLKRDRQTGKFFETIDGLKLKDGYLYKKVSIDSISYVDVVPTTDELLKFKPYKKDTSDDTEWLSHLYGEQRKKRLSECSNGTAKSLDGTSGTKKGKDFQLHDLVFFGPKDFGVIIGVESDSFQILKYDEVEGAEVLSVEIHEIKSGSFEKKFTTADKQMKATSINDTVKVLEGPFTGRQGVVRHICKGTIFIYNDNQLENGGYFCAKSQLCENISHSDDAHHESVGDAFGQGDVFGAQGFEDSTSSPQLSKKPWQEKENNRGFNSRRQGDREGSFSVGQTLRIRVGPLKGHLCRVVSIYRSDITVKVDSQTKVLSVKCEHLSEAGVKSNFMKQNDGFGTQGEASGAPTESNGWNSEPLTTGRSSWPDFSAPDFLLKNPFDSFVTTDVPEKGIEKGDDPWGSKSTSKKASDSWGNAVGSSGDLEKEEGDDPWGSKLTSKKATDCWGNAVGSSGDLGKGKEEGDDPWGSKETSKKAIDSWGNAVGFGEDPGKGKGQEDDPRGSKQTSKEATNSRGNAVGFGGDLEKEGADDPWGSKATPSKKATDNWGNAVGFGEAPGKGKEGGDDPWGSKVTPSKNATDSWGNAVGFGEDPGKGKDEGNDPWGSKETSKNPTEVWKNATDIGRDQKSSWSINKTFDAKQDGCDNFGKGADCWDKGKGVAESDASGWGNAAVAQSTDSWGSKVSSKKATESWGNRVSEDKTTDKKQDGGDNLGKSVAGNDWGAAMTQGAGNIDQSSQVDPWGKATECWMTKDGSSKSKSDWTQSDTMGKAQIDSWSKREAFGGDGATSWGKGTTTGTEDGWNCQKGIDGDRGFDWKKGKANEEGSMDNQQDSWNGPRNFDGGQGSGGRRGRGGFRGGNRDHSGRGRSFGRGRFSGRNNDDHENSKNTTEFGSPSSGWNNDQSNSWQKNNSWGPSSHGTEGNPSQGDGGDAKANSWKSGAADAGGSKSSDWGGTSRGAHDAGGNKSSGWGSGSSWNTLKDSGTNQSSDWNQGNTSSGAVDAAGNKSSGWGNGSWNAPKDSGGNQSSDWNQGALDAGGNKSSGWGNGSNWNTPTKDSGGNQSSDWNQGKTSSGAVDAGGNKSSGWGSGNLNTPKDSGGNQSSDWNKVKTSSGAVDSGGNKSSGWGSGNWNTRSDSGGNQSSDLNQGVATKNNTNWRGGKSFGGGRTSGWGRGSDNDAGESSHLSSRGRGFGNRGGFSNRGRDNGAGESADFSNRGRGFGRGGSSGSSRGGFGNRGCGRRDQTGDWNREKPNEDNQSFGWSKGANNDAGDQVGGWGSQDSGKKGTGNSESWAGDWNKGKPREDNQSFGWSKSENGNAHDQAGGWGNQVSGNKETSNNDSWGGKRSDSWNQSKAAGETKSVGWNKSIGAEGETSGKAGGHADDAWGKPAARSWGSGGGSNGKGAKGETNGSAGSQAEDAWGKSAVSCWGSGEGGSSGKDGW